MAHFTILTNNGVDNTSTDDAREFYFNSGMRDGIVKGAFNEGTFTTLTSNEIFFDTCELRVGGRRVIIDEAWSQPYYSTPSAAERNSVVAQIVIEDNEDVTFDIFVQPASTPLIKDKIFKTRIGAGTYQVEIGRFTYNTNQTITEVSRTIDVITGSRGEDADGGIYWGTITTNTLGHNMPAEFDIEQRYDEEQERIVNDVTVGIPSGSIDNLDDTLSNTSHNAIENQAVTNALNNKADVSDLDDKLNKENPTGTGSFSLNRKANTTVGARSVATGNDTTASAMNTHAEGYDTVASENGAHAEGISTTASGLYSHAEGSNTTASRDYSHAEGYFTTASGYVSHAEGWGTTAQRRSQHALGEFNILDTSGSNVNSKGEYIEIVGNGTANDARSNARTLDWDGNEVLAGTLTTTGLKNSSSPNYTLSMPTLTANRTIATTGYQVNYDTFGLIFHTDSIDIYSKIQYTRLTEKSGILTLSFGVPNNNETGIFRHFNLDTIGQSLGLSFKHSTYYVSGTWNKVNTPGAAAGDLGLGAAIEVNNGNCCCGRYYNTSGNFGGWSLAKTSEWYINVTNLYVEEN